jgi:hypothetical protein
VETGIGADAGVRTLLIRLPATMSRLAVAVPPVSVAFLHAADRAEFVD